MAQHDSTTNARTSIESVSQITAPTRTLRLDEITLDEITKVERVILWRRRQGFTQPRAAAFLCVTKTNLRSVERLESVCNFVIPQMFEEIKPHEACFIMRKRSSLTIPECAKEAGLSRYWFNLMEQGKVSSETLVKYWEEK